MTVQPIPEWSQGAFDAAFEEQANEVGRFNLAVFGKTGVGKSTLINAIFGENVALTGIGRPVTHGSHLYVHRTGKLGIYDTQGLEVGRDTDLILGELRKFLDLAAKQPFVEQVHLAWYCVRANDRRFEHAEADFVTRLVELGLPTVLVMTQVPARHDVEGTLYVAPDALELAREIRHMGLPVYQNRAIMVNALADRFLGIDQHGLPELLDATFLLAPAQTAAALTAAQKIDPARKAAAAEAVIKKATGAAAAAGFTPIPFADAAVLVPIQIGMMARIANIYDIPMDRATVASLAATTAATQAGRFTATGLLKLVPGVGTLLGGTITGGVAGSITFAVGGAWHQVCAGMSAGKYGGVAGALDSKGVQRVFNQEFAAIMRRRNLRGPK
ncbi:MAG: GTPase family protein [Candidatus Nanopelagicales bacterium]